MQGGHYLPAYLAVLTLIDRLKRLEFYFACSYDQRGSKVNGVGQNCLNLFLSFPGKCII